MDTNDKLNILAKTQMKQKDQIDWIDNKMDLIMWMLTKISSWTAPVIPDSEKEDVQVTERLIWFNVMWTFINQDDWQEFIVADFRNKKWPFATREEALAFAREKFWPNERRDFFITNIRWL